MKPTIYEFRAIVLSEEIFQKKYNESFRIVPSDPFKFPDYETDEEKTIEVLWGKFGLNPLGQFYFSEVEKIQLIDQWFNILYPVELDVVAAYHKHKEDFDAMVADFSERGGYNYMRISWDFPSLEGYLRDLSTKYGTYQ